MAIGPSIFGSTHVQRVEDAYQMSITIPNVAFLSAWGSKYQLQLMVTNETGCRFYPTQQIELVQIHGLVQKIIVTKMKSKFIQMKEKKV